MVMRLILPCSPKSILLMLTTVEELLSSSALLFWGFVICPKDSDEDQIFGQIDEIHGFFVVFMNLKVYIVN